MTDSRLPSLEMNLNAKVLGVARQSDQLLLGLKVPPVAAIDLNSANGLSIRVRHSQLDDLARIAGGSTNISTDQAA